MVNKLHDFLWEIEVSSCDNKNSRPKCISNTLHPFHKKMINYVLRISVIINIIPSLTITDNKILVCSDWRLDFVIFHIFTVTTICYALFILRDMTTLNVSAVSTNYEPPTSVGITTSILITNLMWFLPCIVVNMWK